MGTIHNKSYLDILKYYSKDEIRKRDNDVCFNNEDNKENKKLFTPNNNALKLNENEFFSLLLKDEIKQKHKNCSDMQYNKNINNNNENNLYGIYINQFDGCKLANKLKKEHTKKKKYMKKEHSFINKKYIKLENYFLNNKNPKFCTICFHNNNIEYLEKCKGCSLYFHVHCYKTFCDHFNLDRFLCDVCIETNYYTNKNRNNYLSILGDKKKYNFSYPIIYDSDNSENDELYNGHDDVYVANFFGKINNLNFQNDEDKKTQIKKHKKLYTKYLSDHELCDSNKYMIKVKESYFLKKKNKKKDEFPSVCNKSNRITYNEKENCEGIDSDCYSDVYYSDSQFDRNILNFFGIYNNSFSTNHSSIIRNNKDIIKRLKESQKMISNMFPEKIIKQNKNNKSNYIHYIQYKMRRKIRREIRKEIKEFNKCKTDNISELGGEYNNKVNDYWKVNIVCDICNKSNNDVIMKKGKNNKWFHICCLYYNNITKNNSIAEIYFEYFFFNYYNEDYFVNLYGRIKTINEIIIKKIKEQLLNKYNILIHSHSFNFLLNPYYYNLTLKQIKNIIYYNFILKKNFIYQTSVNNNTIPYLRLKHEKNENVISCRHNNIVHLKNLSSQNIYNLKNEKQIKESYNYVFITTDKSSTESANETCSYNSENENNENCQLNQGSYIINNKKIEIKNSEIGENYEEIYEEELIDKNESKKDNDSMYCIDTNNCTIINDGSYFCEDVLNIINNFKKSEFNDNMVKQSEYNNMFKDIEKLIYKRDFLNLNIIKIIKEKIIESIKINNSKICIFCKKSAGIKTKCMYPSCFEYFHIYCYFKNFFNSYKKKKQLNYFKRDLKVFTTIMKKLNKSETKKGEKKGNKKRMCNSLKKNIEILQNDESNGILEATNYVDKESQDIYLCEKKTKKRRNESNLINKGEPVDVKNDSKKNEYIDCNNKHVRKIRKKVEVTQNNGDGNNTNKCIDNPNNYNYGKINHNIENKTVEKNDNIDTSKLKNIINKNGINEYFTYDIKLKKNQKDEKLHILENGDENILKKQKGVTIPIAYNNTNVNIIKNNEIYNNLIGINMKKTGNIFIPNNSGTIKGIPSLHDRHFDKIENMFSSNNKIMLINEGILNNDKNIGSIKINQSQILNDPDKIYLGKNIMMVYSSQNIKNREKQDLNLKGNNSKHLCHKIKKSNNIIRNNLSIIDYNKYINREKPEVGGVTTFIQNYENQGLDFIYPSIINNMDRVSPIEIINKNNQNFENDNFDNISCSSSLLFYSSSSNAFFSKTEISDKSSINSLSQLLSKSYCSISSSNNLSTIPSVSSSSSFSICSYSSSAFSPSVYDTTSNITSSYDYISDIDSDLSSHSVHSLPFPLPHNKLERPIDPISNKNNVFNERGKQEMLDVKVGDSTEIRTQLDVKKENKQIHSIFAFDSADYSSDFCEHNQIDKSMHLHKSGLKYNNKENWENINLGYISYSDNDNNHKYYYKFYKYKKHLYYSRQRKKAKEKSEKLKKMKKLKNLKKLMGAMMVMKKEKKVKMNENSKITIKKKKKIAIEEIIKKNNLNQYKYNDKVTNKSKKNKKEKKNTLGLYIKNVEIVYNNNVQLKNIKLIMCNNHNNEEDIETVMDIKLNTYNNKTDNNVKNIFYYYYTEFIKSVFFSDKFSHIFDKCESFKDSKIKEALNTDSEKNEQNEKIEKNQKKNKRRIDSVESSWNIFKNANEVGKNASKENMNISNLNEENISLKNKKQKTKCDSTDVCSEAKESDGENQGLTKGNEAACHSVNEQIKDMNSSTSEEVTLIGEIFGGNELELINSNSKNNLEKSDKSNENNLSLFIKYINKIIENIEARIIIKNNVCEGVYCLRQENGLNIYQKISDKMKKKCKLKNIKKEKNKNAKVNSKIANINSFKNININIKINNNKTYIKSGNTNNNNNNNYPVCTELKKRVDINKYSYLFYRLPFFIFGNKYITDIENFKTIYNISELFQNNNEIVDSKNILTVVELLKSYSNHAFFKKNPNSLKRSFTEKDEKTWKKNPLDLLGNSEELNFQSKGVLTEINVELNNKKVDIIENKEEIHENDGNVVENVDKIKDSGNGEDKEIATLCLSKGNSNKKEKKKEKKKNPNNNIEEEWGGYNENQNCEQNKETQYYANKSFNIIFCLFDNGSNIYLLIYESDSDNRKKHVKKKNEFNNIDYYFKEMYETLHENTYKEDAYKILKSIFSVSNNINNDVKNILYNTSTEDKCENKTGGEIEIKLNTTSSNKLSPNKINSKNMAINNMQSNINKTISTKNNLNNYKNKGNNIHDEEINSHRINEIMLNKKLLQNILSNFKFFNITKNKGLKLSRVFELTYYDYLFLKKHKFFYSKKGVKIYDGCNNPYKLLSAQKYVNTDLDNSNIILKQNEEYDDFKKNDNMLSYKFKQITNKFYFNIFDPNNSSFYFRGIPQRNVNPYNCLISLNNISNHFNLKNIDSYTKNSKDILIPNMNFIKLVQGNYDNLLELFGNKNFENILRGKKIDILKKKYINSNSKDKQNNKKCISKQRDKNKKKKKKSLIINVGEKVTTITNTDDVDKFSNKINNSINKSEETNSNKTGEYISKEKQIKDLINEDTKNLLDDINLNGRIEQVIDKYTNLEYEINATTAANNNNDNNNIINIKRNNNKRYINNDSSASCINSFSTYDIYKLFLFDNCQNSKVQEVKDNNESLGNDQIENGKNLESFIINKSENNNQNNSIIEKTGNKDEKIDQIEKKNITDYLLNKYALNCFRNYVINKKQTEFFYKNIKSFINSLEKKQLFSDINNILSFCNNEKKYMNKIKWESILEDKDNNYLKNTNFNGFYSKSKVSYSFDADHQYNVTNYYENNQEKYGNNIYQHFNTTFSYTSKFKICNEEFKNNSPSKNVKKNNKYFLNEVKKSPNNEKDINISPKKIIEEYKNLENFNYTIDDNMKNMKKLYHNINKEVVKNKLLLVNKIIEENHEFNISDMPMYVNLVFYKYLCVNNWNHLIHSLKESFIKQEIFFLSQLDAKNSQINEFDKNGKVSNSSITSQKSCQNNEIKKTCTKSVSDFQHIEQQRTQECDSKNISTPSISDSKGNENVISETIENKEKLSDHNKRTENGKDNKTGKEGDKKSDVLCSVCFYKEDSNINIMYKCANCSVHVHKYCYGIYHKGKVEDFLCDKCKFSKYLTKMYQNEFNANKSNNLKNKKNKKNSNTNSKYGLNNSNIDNTCYGTNILSIQEFNYFNNKINNLFNNTNNNNNNNNSEVKNKSLSNGNNNIALFEKIIKSVEDSCCYICKKNGGALKKTTNKHFVHVFCVLFFILKVFCLNVYNLNFWDINNLKSYEKVCFICNKKGAVVKCAWNGENKNQKTKSVDELKNENKIISNNCDMNNFKKDNLFDQSKKNENYCDKYFHPMCAYLEGYHINVEIYEDKFVNVYFYDNCFSLFRFITHCNNHIPKDSYQNREFVKEKRTSLYIKNITNESNSNNKINEKLQKVKIKNESPTKINTKPHPLRHNSQKNISIPSPNKNEATGTTIQKEDK
ncbi:phd finger protein, putative [Plasmodium berghei]|uniref:Phd finger protein, putative n=1 Tax=Plasmodium berghei TaxID=5821 RepID=A0A0Y9UE25_PLABE|nr:phd finger protein, putative [Plasmodium berghei]